jgi:hypothetical protein
MAKLRGVRGSISEECFRANHQAESDADMPLLTCLSRTWTHIQGNLFPRLTEELGPLTAAHKRVVTAVEIAGVEAFVQVWPRGCRAGRHATGRRWRGPLSPSR